jgi:SAM-dependent methyltransferase
MMLAREPFSEIGLMKKEALEPLTAAEIRYRITKWLVEQTNGEIQSGPFKGVKMLSETVWKESNLAPQIIGCYESELHDCIEHEIRRLEKIEHPRVVDIGCAEGYYAVGLAKRLPHAEVYAIDISEESLKIVQRAAELNGVENLSVAPLLMDGTTIDFIMCDCEGHEIDYLDPKKFPQLVNTHMLVEMHDFPDQPTTEIVYNRFKDTHDVYIMYEAGRNPNQFDFMVDWHNISRWLAVSEGRPVRMYWMFFKPKEENGN